MGVGKPINLRLLVAQAPFSITKVWARILIRYDLIKGFSSVSAWNFIFYTILAFSYVLSDKINQYVQDGYWVIGWIIAYIAYARINELVMAFYGDAISRVMKDGSDLKHQLKIWDYQRIILLTAAYIEIVWQFGLLYYVTQIILSRKIFKEACVDIWDCLYFSGVTITTTGYGDFVPIGVARIISVYEALVGIVFITLGLAAYMTGTNKPPRTD